MTGERDGAGRPAVRRSPSETRPGRNLPESALVVPVPEADPLVDPWRRRHDPSCGAGVPAHITILYPFLGPGLLTGDVVDELRALFTGVRPFRFELTSTGRFPGVAYLAPEPAEPFARFTAAVETLWPETRTYAGAHGSVVPHLTVAQGADPGVIDSLRSELEPLLPLEAECTEVWLMVSDGSNWTLKWRFPLGGPPGEKPG